jgi:hypothetical protein
MRNNMKKISNENNPEEPEISEDSIETDEAKEKQEKAREDNAQLLRSSLKGASEGIGIGITEDLASKRDPGSFIGDIAELIMAPLILSTPGRALERGIKGAHTDLITPDYKINTEAKNRLQERVITPSINLYNSNFESLISVLNKIPYIKDLKPNNITNINAFAIEFKGRSVSISTFSQESPYKLILKRIIPMLREKFDAVASFDKTLGPGEKIDYEGLSQDLLDGMEIKEDIVELERFYKAIIEWRAVLGAFKVETDNTAGMSSGSDKSDKADKKETDDGDEEDSSGGVLPGNNIAENIYIDAVRPGQYVHRDPTGEGGLFINNHALNSEDTPVVKLFIKGEGADDVNSSGSGEAYLKHFVENPVPGRAVYLPRGMKLFQIIYNVTRETVSEGSEITIYFRPDGVRAIKGSSTERIEIMRVSTSRGDIPIFVDDVSQVNSLRRAASTESTPYYQTVSPGGEAVFFTPADLVISGGTVKDSKGNKFKPKKIKGKSLAQRVMSKDFGKVRRKK